MSELPPQADLSASSRHVAFVPEPAVSRCNKVRVKRVLTQSPETLTFQALHAINFGLRFGGIKLGKMRLMNIPTANIAADAPVLLREREKDIAILVLNRPDVRNSLSEAMLIALSSALGDIAADNTVRAVVLAANGSAFCAGHDLKELTSRRSDADGGRAYFHHLMTTCGDMMQQIVHLPQPIIAAVQGVATAAGCQLVASCDLAVASRNARFATPGVDIGLFCSTPMVALSRNVARKHAMEMLLTGDAASADDAYRIGLINRVVDSGAEREEALVFARKIAEKSSHIVKIGKEAFYRQAEMNLADAYRYASEVMVENLMARDAEEGLKAFIDKRAPKWEDR
jgi:enoyl-CoA hydratase/carnithine racemase